PGQRSTRHSAGQAMIAPCSEWRVVVQIDRCRRCCLLGGFCRRFARLLRSSLLGRFLDGFLRYLRGATRRLLGCRLACLFWAWLELEANLAVFLGGQVGLELAVGAR